MFESFKNEPEEGYEKDNIKEVSPDKSIDLEITENPRNFLNWFNSFKDSIGVWPEKFLKDKTLRNSILYASITDGPIIGLKFRGTW